MTEKVYLDANILIAHQITGHKYHKQAKHILDYLWKQGKKFVISSLTMDEFFYGIIFVLTSNQKGKIHNPFSKYSKLLSKATQAIFAWDNIELVVFTNTKSQLFEVINLMKQFNLRPRDAFHLRLMQQLKITSIATFDQDFDSVAEKEAIKIFS